ncbi:MAG: flagellar basal body P-ring protein FlgI, partial [Planctomycetales bacterium]|nr:flagellar basal body P-ring protein FlgI [Planctomycetales bacterium]
MLRNVIVALILTLTVAHLPALAVQVRIKDITTKEGDRDNVIVGIGLVTGLTTTGGKSPLTRQYLADLTTRLGRRFDPSVRAGIFTNSQLKTEGVSVVMVTANLPSNGIPGQKIDLLVSIIDDAKSLQGGVLAPTLLIGPDNEVYATGAGPVSLGGGFSFGGQAATASKAFTTTARVVGGGTIERATPNDTPETGCTHLLLTNPDITTAQNIIDAINQLEPGAAEFVTDAAVKLYLPSVVKERGRFLARVTNLYVDTDQRAIVAINDRTGTVVMGHQVRISSVALAHGSLTVVTSESPGVSQPAPFSLGETTVVPRTDIEVVEEKRPITTFADSATVGDLADGLTKLGVSPGDM